MFCCIQTAAATTWLTPQPGVSDAVWREGQELPPKLLCSQMVASGAGWLNLHPIDLGNAGEEYSFLSQGVFASLLARKQWQRAMIAGTPRSGTLVIFERDPSAGTPTWKVWNAPGTVLKWVVLPAPYTGGAALAIQYTATVPLWVADNDFIPSLRGVGILDGSGGGLLDGSGNRLVS